MAGFIRRRLNSMSNIKIIGLYGTGGLALGIGAILLSDYIRPGKVEERKSAVWLELEDAYRHKDGVHIDKSHKIEEDSKTIQERARIRRKYKNSYKHKDIEMLVDKRMSSTNYFSDAERYYNKAQMLHQYYGKSENARGQGKYRTELVWEYIRDWYRKAAELDLQYLSEYGTLVMFFGGDLESVLVLWKDGADRGDPDCMNSYAWFGLTEKIIGE